MLGNSEQYQFEPPVLEEESYASNDSFDGLKREHMIHFFYKWLLWKRRYIIEMNTFRNSFRKFCDLLASPHSLSLFGFCCVRAHVTRAPLWMRMQMHNDIVIQSYSCTTRCDVMFLSIPFYKAKVMIILVFWCNCVKTKLCICDRLTMHLVREHLIP